ncbi:ead/Ea22-like family protein [Pseudomonas aeruginosa]|uniref:ead/Ea22-like family protein n=1 Tax=Pseudomonas aeruginosa TaxID=287 RepID=UPI001CD3CD3C|nr:ead/Ea22-like family protein [Pseudomonas aeruginosa]
MTDHAELRRLAKAATPGHWSAVWEEGDDTAWPNMFPIIQAENSETVIGNEGFYSDLDQDKANAQFCAAANPKTVLALLDEIDGLKAENDALRGALQAVQAEVDGNLRPLTRDLVNMVSGLNNGTHPNDIYDHCDEIERIIGAVLEGATQ